MSEGMNVTSGVAMRDPVLPPEKPQKQKGLGEFEKEISAAVAQAGKKKVGALLESANSQLSLGDHVKVDGLEGRIVGKTGSDRVSIKFTDGHQKTYDVNGTHIEVIKKNPGYSKTADSHYRDATAARRATEPARVHHSMSQYHEWMAKHYEWEGLKTEAEGHRAKAEVERQEALRHENLAAKGSGFVPQREMQAKAKQAGRDAKARQQVAASKKSTYHHFYNVPFADKDKAREAGLKWDPAEKKWFMPSEMRSHSATGKLPWKFSHTYDNYYGKRHDD